MKATINTLEIALHNLERNELIHRKEGDAERADAATRDAVEIRDALLLLHAATPCMADGKVVHESPIAQFMTATKAKVP